MCENKKIKKASRNTHQFEFQNFEVFKTELSKQKVRFALGKETNEWREYFNETKLIVDGLKNKIQQIDTEIDKMGYKIYHLTKEDIEIIENVTNK